MSNIIVDLDDDFDGDLEVDNGDLSAWEYFTANFDDIGFLHDQNIGDEFMFAINTKENNLLLDDEFLHSDISPVFTRSTLQPRTVFCERFTAPPASLVFDPSSDSGEISCYQQSRMNYDELNRNVHSCRMATSGDIVFNHSWNQSRNMPYLSSNPLHMRSENLSLTNDMDLSSNALRLMNHDSGQNSVDYNPPHPSHKLLKPLTAYRYFYRVERERIMQGLASCASHVPEPIQDFSDAKLHELLDRRWYLDPNKKKRAHRKTFGNFGFANFSRIISQRWQSLSPEGQQFYHRVADMDKAQYELNLNFFQLNEA